MYWSSYDNNYLETGTDNNGNVRYEPQYPNTSRAQDILRSYTHDGANRLSSYTEPANVQGSGIYD